MAGVAASSLTGLGLSGLSSGLDTTGIITKLMAIETAPKTALQTKLSNATAYRTALQSLNSGVAALATSAKDAAKPAGLVSFTTTSSATAVSAKASSTAIAGSLSFTVDQLASSQVSVTGVLADTSSVVIPALTFRTGTGSAQKDTTVTLTSNNLDDVVGAVNGSDAGVTATKVPAGTSSDGAQQYRLQFASKSPGASGAFSASVGATYDAGSPLPMTTVAQPQDAQVKLYGGTDAEQVVTSSTNTFSSLMTGVDVTVSATTITAATITVARDATAATTAAQGLVLGLSTLFSGISAATAVTTSSSAGSTKTTGGVFTGDSAVRLLKDSLLAAASDSVDGKSPSTIGIVLTKDGTVTFDQAKFAAAMQSDPVGTTAMFQTIAGRVAEKATAASDPYTGTLTQRVTSQQSSESALTKEIDDWTVRLARIQAQYTTQFNALETALNSLSSQANYLTGQIAGLTTNYQSTK